MFNSIGFVVNAGLTALNAALFVGHDNPWNLGAAIFCALCAALNLALAVTE